MSDITGIEGTQLTQSLLSGSATSRAGVRSREAEDSPAESEDRVELSELGRMLAQVRDLPDIRIDKIIELRQQIAAGSYETPEKIQVVVDRILKELG